MEDQQPAAGDLTDESRDDSGHEETQADTVVADTEVTDDTTAAPTDTVETELSGESGADVSQPGESETEESETEGSDSEESESEESVDVLAAPDDAASVPPAKKRRRKTGRVAAVLVAIAAVLFVGSSAAAGAMVQPYLAERANIDVKLKVARAAAQAITTLWSYTPENMDSLASRAGHYLTGDFGAQYRKFVEESVVAPNKQYKVTTSTEVTGVAVETLDGPNATVIVYTNTTTTTPLKKNIPSMQYLSYLLTMKRDGDRWLVSRMNTITSLDVTAQL